MLLDSDGQESHGLEKRKEGSMERMVLDLELNREADCVQ